MQLFIVRRVRYVKGKQEWLAFPLLKIHFSLDSEQIPPRLSLLISLTATVFSALLQQKPWLLSEMAGMKRAAPLPDSYINHFVLLIHLITCKEKAAALQAPAPRAARNAAGPLLWAFCCLIRGAFVQRDG